MSSKINYDKLKHIGNIKTPAIDKPKEKAKGGWTHIKRKPVKQFSKSEIDEWIKTNPDRLHYKPDKNASRATEAVRTRSGRTSKIARMKQWNQLSLEHAGSI